MDNATINTTGRTRRLKEEWYLRVDIRELKRKGLLAPGISGSIQYTCHGGPTGSISFKVLQDRLILIYGRRAEVSWEDGSTSVNFARTSCHYGGQRVWFTCPACKRRVAILYSTPRGFLCRHCAHLTYASKCETQIDRLIRRARKIRKRISGEGTTVFNSIMIKPPRMHWKTYRRFREKLFETEFQLMDEMSAVFERLSHRIC